MQDTQSGSGGVAICASSDPFVDHLPSGWVVLEPAALADQRVTLSTTGARCGDRTLSALYWSPPKHATFAASFEPDEAKFVDREVVALWSGVSDVPGMRCNLSGYGFHAFGSSQWLALRQLAIAAGHRAAPHAPDGPSLWLAHNTERPVHTAQAALPGAVTAPDEPLEWWWSAAATAFPESPQAGARDAEAQALAATFARAGFQHVRFSVAPDGALVTCAPFSDGPTTAPGRMSAVRALADWYASPCVS